MSAVRSALSRKVLLAIAEAGSPDALSRCILMVCGEIGATHYLLLGAMLERSVERPRVITANWVYDTVQMLGPERIARLAADGGASGMGETPPPLFGAGRHPRSEAEALLHSHGHGELYCLPLQGGRRRCRLFLSSTAAGSIDTRLLPQAQLACSYLVSRLPGTIFAQRPQDALSERERECLLWVSEGKTTDEVAVILGVSANTVNSYLAHAIQKCGASNRAMAIATAIRTGAI